MKNKTNILLLITYILFVIYFVVKQKTKKTIIQPINISDETIANGSLSEQQIKVLSRQINAKIKGLTIYEVDYLQSLLNISDIDFIRLFNMYLDLFNNSLYQDVINEWYWSNNKVMYETVKQRFINLHANF